MSAASHPAILFIADAGPRVGGGHVMRSLTLARALEDAGATCRFLVTPAGQAVFDAFGGGISSIATGDVTQAELIERAASAARDHDAVVIDHYGLSAPDHRAIAAGRPTLVIDDLADRPLAADLVLDSGPTRDAADYDGLAPAGAERLLGPNHAPVRPAFAALRRDALARRAAAPSVRRILVSLGLTDVGAITGRVVDLMLPRIGDAVTDVVLGSGAASLPGLRALAGREPRLALHVDSQDMPRLTLQADLAVGAGARAAGSAASWPCPPCCWCWPPTSARPARPWPRPTPSWPWTSPIRTSTPPSRPSFPACSPTLRCATACRRRRRRSATGEGRRGSRRISWT